MPQRSRNLLNLIISHLLIIRYSFVIFGKVHSSKLKWKLTVLCRELIVQTRFAPGNLVLVIKLRRHLHLSRRVTFLVKLYLINDLMDLRL